MDANGIVGIAGEISLVPQQCASLNVFFKGPRRKLGIDVGGPILISQVGVIGPDLATGLERVIRDADDDSGFPIW